jgi:hypothetical protein
MGFFFGRAPGAGDNDLRVVGFEDATGLAADPDVAGDAPDVSSAAFGVSGFASAGFTSVVGDAVSAFGGESAACVVVALGSTGFSARPVESSVTRVPSKIPMVRSATGT